MFRTVANNLWAFDLEWVPDPPSGRRAYDLPADMPDADVLEVMWSHARSSDEEPKPQLVGFNSRTADVPILLQRGIAQGVCATGFCHRPNKPWEGIDYFAKGDGHVDLKEIVAGWGKGTPSLHEFATACGIPGKMGTTGDDVLGLWQAGDVRRIVEYNQYDALTTYLVWLRTALFAGLISPEGHAAEEECLRDMLRRRIAAGDMHLQLYLDKWAALAALM